MDKVKVLFRMSKNPYTECWECEAFFPEFIASPGMMQCYSEEGWCEASLDYYHNTERQHRRSTLRCTLTSKTNLRIQILMI